MKIKLEKEQEEKIKKIEEERKIKIEKIINDANEIIEEATKEIINDAYNEYSVGIENINDEIKTMNKNKKKIDKKLKEIKIYEKEIFEKNIKEIIFNEIKSKKIFTTVKYDFGEKKRYMRKINNNALSKENIIRYLDELNSNEIINNYKYNAITESLNKSPINVLFIKNNE